MIPPQTRAPVFLWVTMALNISQIHTGLNMGAKSIACEFNIMKLCSLQVEFDLLILWALLILLVEAQTTGFWIPSNRFASLSCLSWAPLKFPQVLWDMGLGQPHTLASTAKAQLSLGFPL